MIRYISRRLLLSIPVLLGVTLVIFLTTRVMPGTPIERRMHALVASEEERQALMARYGYDQPVHIQYVQYLSDIVRGDFGVSFTTGHRVSDDINARLMPTLEVAVYSLVLAMGLGLPLGLLAALRQNSLVDHVVRVLSTVGVAAPSFWVGMLLVYFFFYRLRLAPPPLGRISIGVGRPDHLTGFFTVDALLTGNRRAFFSSVGSLILPTATLGLSALAPIARMIRGEAVEVLRAPYVRAARACGLRERTILLHHVLKNTLLPAITLTGIILGFMLGGVVVVESVFSWPGLGLYAYKAVSGNDYPAIQAFALYTTGIYILVFLVLDMLYAYLDPRIRR